jgi:predicted dehydrogenase
MVMPDENQLILNATNQFAPEIDHMAVCVLENRIPRTPGEEGVDDHILMEAIYQSAQSGIPVRFEAVNKLDAYRGAPATVDSK